MQTQRFLRKICHPSGLGVPAGAGTQAPKMRGRVLGTRQGPIRVRVGNEQVSVRERGGDSRNEAKAREPELESELGARADMEPPWMRASGSGLQPPERPARGDLKKGGFRD